MAAAAAKNKIKNKKKKSKSANGARLAKWRKQRPGVISSDQYVKIMRQWQ
jgi:hypothetical protein